MNGLMCSCPLVARVFGLAVLLVGLLGTPLRVAHAQSEETWESIRGDIFGEEPILDGSALITLKTPNRAEDAALVPFAFTASEGTHVRDVSIIIDENPAPVAAVFRFGSAAVNADFSTRFRVNSYSYVRAVARLDDGKLYMVRNFVKASGGCSAPATKDLDKAPATLGRMKIRTFPHTERLVATAGNPVAIAGGDDIASAQIMIRHPNYSGLQMNQLTMLYVPARFIDNLTIKHGDETILSVEGGISLSEDPVIRFSYRASNTQPLRVDATDTDGAHFTHEWQVPNPVERLAAQ